MTRHGPTLLLSLILLSGCASRHTGTASEGAEPEFAPSTGLCASPWGDLPTYRQPAPPRVTRPPKPGADRDLEGTTVVDILVNRDGTVRDVAIVKSSGKPEVDAAAIALARSFHYPARIHPGDPAPYVVPNIRLNFGTAEMPGPPISYPYHTN